MHLGVELGVSDEVSFDNFFPLPKTISYSFSPLKFSFISTYLGFCVYNELLLYNLTHLTMIHNDKANTLARCIQSWRRTSSRNVKGMSFLVTKFQFLVRKEKSKTTNALPHQQK